MTIHLAADGVKLVLLDVEGTTTPISFVSEVLFPYARSHLRAFLRDHAPDRDVAAAIGLLRDERERNAPPELAQPLAAGSAAELDALATFAESLMARDSKSPGLKALQGLIWAGGYASGELRGDVFDDVPAAMRRWPNHGVQIAIYSSGSVLAQRLLFSSTRYGDLTTEIDRYFDTAVGAKQKPTSYTEITQQVGLVPRSVLFLSDVEPELEAAVSAGCQAGLVIRPGNADQTGSKRFQTIRSLSEIQP